MHVQTMKWNCKLYFFVLNLDFLQFLASIEKGQTYLEAYFRVLNAVHLEFGQIDASRLQILQISRLRCIKYSIIMINVLFSYQKMALPFPRKKSKSKPPNFLFKIT